MNITQCVHTAYTRCILYITHCVQDGSFTHCIPHNVYHTLYHILYITHCIHTLYIIYYRVFTVYYILLCIHCVHTLYNVYHTLWQDGSFTHCISHTVYYTMCAKKTHSHGRSLELLAWVQCTGAVHTFSNTLLACVQCTESKRRGVWRVCALQCAYANNVCAVYTCQQRVCTAHMPTTCVHCTAHTPTTCFQCTHETTCV